MAHYEPPHQELHCLQIQLLSSLVHVLKELKENISDQCANGQSSYGTSSLLFPVFIWTNRSGYDHCTKFCTVCSDHGQYAFSGKRWIFIIMLLVNYIRDVISHSAESDVIYV